MLNKMIRTLTLACTILLCGCVSLNLTQTTATTPFSYLPRAKRTARLSRITQWLAQGALSVQYNHQASLANYRWQQFSRYRYQIHLSSSLNLYVLNIQGEKGKISLNDTSHTITQGRSPEILLRQHVGYPLPVSNLYYWIRGLAAPGQYRAQYDPFTHLIALTQQGWTVHFSHFSSYPQGDLPHIMTLKRPGFKIKIVIKRWGLP